MNRLIRKYVRELLLLSEGDSRIEKRLDALLAMPPAAVRISKANSWFKIEYGVELSNGQFIAIMEDPYSDIDSVPGALEEIESEVDINDLPTGYIACNHGFSSQDGPCYNGYVVDQSYAKKGWGPLLYELAIEYASSQDPGWSSSGKTGLTPDRVDVSKEAQQVWRKYQQRGDIEKLQLDIDQSTIKKFKRRLRGKSLSLDQLTPSDFSDDCKQDKSVALAGVYWAETPTAQMYHKSNSEYLEELRASGKLIE